MATPGAAALTVVPAYRVVAHFIRQVGEMEGDRALDYLEQKLRQYVRSSLSSLQGPYAEIGERWAVTQLGDPDPATLAEALKTADKAAPRRAIEDALGKCTRLLPRPDLSARFLLLPGDGGSNLLTQEMRGAIGVSLGSQVTLLFFWPVGDWLSYLAYTAAHEYAHLVRNHLLPRGMTGGRLLYLKTQEPETLLDAMIAEGIADVFAGQIFPDVKPHWTSGDPGATAPEGAGEARIWPALRRHLRADDPNEIRRFISGDGDRVPQWAGYVLGCRIVQAYLERHPSTRPANLVGMSGGSIFRESGYGDEVL